MEYQKQIARVQAQQAAKEAHHLKQLAQAHEAAGSEAKRLQQQAEAEISDLKATISRLEVDLIKVSGGHSGEITTELTGVGHLDK